jgi:ceramide glucosyltransferase
LAAGYAALACLALLAWRLRRAAMNSTELPPVTVLKPLCGAEAGLYENLRSFCRLDYPEFQIVFGVHDPADPALSVVERLRAEFSWLAIDVVLDPEQHGANLKIGNLINMLERARHDVLVMADSDTWVGPDYLSTVTAPLHNPDVGLVTCLYHDVPTRRIWSRLGAMYINEWYMPSVLLAWLFGFRGYASGQTLCIRRNTLQAIGGLRAIANHLAEDNRLGELVRASGQRIVLSTYPVHAQHDEPDASSLIGHELRWLQTIRVLRPASFRLLFLSFSLPLAVFGIALAAAERSTSITAWVLFWITVAARLVLHLRHRFQDGRLALSDLWLLPARDLLICLIWCGCFCTSRILWRGNEFDVDADGVMHRAS